jgi:hypothetical protein
MPKPLFAISRQVGNHIFEIAGRHRLFHVILRLFDSFMSHLKRNERDADLIRVLMDQGSRAIPHEPFRSALQPLKRLRRPRIGR